MMGCDIHAHIEVKIDNEWLYWGGIDLSRNYTLFGVMAGVRCQKDTIAEPRGLPSDISKQTKFQSDVYGSDGHSHSWLNSREFISVIEQFSLDSRKDQWTNIGYLMGDSYKDFYKYPEDRTKGIQDFRLVFWFDN